MILLLLPLWEDPDEGLKLNLFFMFTTGRTKNNECCKEDSGQKQGKAFFEGKILKLLDRLPRVVTAFLLLPKLFLKVFKPLLKMSLPQDEQIV